MKKILFTFLLLVVVNVNAAVIYNETTNPALDNVFLDAGQSSVDTSNNDLEWLSFKNDNTAYTLGYSMNEMGTYYSNQGWVFASETQVSNLFDLFFGDFNGTANGTQVISPEDPANTLIQSRNSWLLSFGTDADVASDGTINSSNGLLYSTGMYQNDDGSIGIAGIKIDASGITAATTLYGPEYGISSFDMDTKYSNLGVFMVRSSRQILPPVPVPAAVWLMMSGLLGLVAVARHKA